MRPTMSRGSPKASLRRGYHRFTHVGGHRTGDRRPERRVADELHHAVGLRREPDPADQQAPEDLPGLVDAAAHQPRPVALTRAAPGPGYTILDSRGRVLCDTAAPMDSSTIPAFLSIDVEPDGFQLDRRDPPPWTGVTCTSSTTSTGCGRTSPAGPGAPRSSAGMCAQIHRSPRCTAAPPRPGRVARVRRPAARWRTHQVAGRARAAPVTSAAGGYAPR
jgi:hypothetical protein